MVSEINDEKRVTKEDRPAHTTWQDHFGDRVCSARWRIHRIHGTGPLGTTINYVCARVTIVAVLLELACIFYDELRVQSGEEEVECCSCPK